MLNKKIYSILIAACVLCTYFLTWQGIYQGQSVIDLDKTVHTPLSPTNQLDSFADNESVSTKHESMISPLNYEEFWKLVQAGNRTDVKDEMPLERYWLSEQSSHDSDSISSIPRIIHKVYIQNRGGFQNEEDMGEPLKEALQSWKTNNPNYTLQLFDLHRCRAYLYQHFHPVFLRAFDCIEAFAGKADLFRLAVVYREGGWYSDWKQICFQDRFLDNIRAENITLFLNWDKGNAVSMREKCIQNALFGAVPRHPVLAQALKLILTNVQKQHYGLTAIHSTGPCVLGQAYANVTEKMDLAGVRFGSFQQRHFFYNRSSVVRHKCDGCGNSQNWESGNSYEKLYRERKYYCEDAASLFLPLDYRYLG